MRSLFALSGWSLRAKMAALLIAASLLPLTLIAVLDIRHAREQLVADTARDLAARSEQIALEIDALNSGFRRSAAVLARSPAVLAFCQRHGEAVAPEAMQPFLRADPESSTEVRGTAILDPAGIVRAASDGALIGVDLSRHAFVRQAARGDVDVVVSDLRAAEPQLGGMPLVAFVAPVLGLRQEVIGLVAVWVRAAALVEVLATRDALLGPGSFALLLDAQGARIATSRSPQRESASRTQTTFPEALERARAPALDTAVFRSRSGVTGQWIRGVARRPQTVPWMVFYMVGEDAIDARIAQMTRDRALVAAACIGLALLVGGSAAAAILRPVREDFDAMTAKLQAQAHDLQRSRDELELRVQQRTADLREREEQTRAIVDNALDAVITMGADGRITGWNTQAERSFGWPRSEAVGRMMSEILVPRQYREAHTRGLQRYLATGEAAVLNKRLELSALHRDGHEFPVELSITPIDSGERLAFSAFVRDISERKRTEEARMRLAALVESSDDAIIGKTLQGIITSWNPGAHRLFGYAADEVIGRPMLILLPPQRSGEESEILARLARGERVEHFETVRVRQDGSLVDVSVSISPVRDEQGQVIGASTIARDIGERKRSEERLRAQLERLNLLDQITCAIGERQDLQSIYQVAIRSLEERLPVDFTCVGLYDAADHAMTVTRVGTHSRTLAMELVMHEHARIAVDANGLSRCVQGQLVYEPDIATLAFPFPQRLARGGLRSLVLAPLLAESRVFGVLVAARREAHAFSSGECEFLRQLSAHVALAAQQAQLYGALQQAYDDLRQTQAAVLQQERLRALGQMASGIAHDINNALSPVALYTQSLLDREPGLSARARDYLQHIDRAIADVGATVSRLREFYRQREPQLALSTVQLNALVRQVLDLTRARWSDMPQQCGNVIELRTELDPELPHVMGVESEIREALINLVFNAIDAMPAGGTLSVRTRSLDAPTPQAVIDVSDSGVGMDEQTKARCLEPFFTTKGERGTGLGLAMVFGVAQRHGAELHIDSQLGRGTTMSLHFPVARGAPLEDVPAAPSVSSLAQRLRLLVIDDDPVLLNSLQDTLQAEGHVVSVANGGQAGIDAFLAAQRGGPGFSAVITDLGMPYVDGRRVATAVKQAAPAMPVVLLTGWGQRLVAEGDIPEHVDQVLSKPPKLRELREALARLTRTAEV